MEYSVLQRIKEIMEIEGLTVNAFSKSIDVPRSTISSMYKKKTFPGFEVIKKISDAYPTYSLDWLINGIGNKYKDVGENMSDEYDSEAIPFYADLPVSAGKMALVTSCSKGKPNGFMLIPGIKAESLFPVIGCSMLPKIKAGDFIGVNTVSNWDRTDPDKIYMIVTKEERMIKRLKSDQKDDSILWCISDNYQDFKIYKDDILKIYHVVYHGESL